MRLWGIIPGKASWGEFTGGIAPTGSEWCLQIRFGGDAVTQTVAAAGAALLLAPRGKSPPSNLLCCRVRAAIKMVSLVTGLNCIRSEASKHVGKPIRPFSCLFVLILMTFLSLTLKLLEHFHLYSSLTVFYKTCLIFWIIVENSNPCLLREGRHFKFYCHAVV